MAILVPLRRTTPLQSVGECALDELVVRKHRDTTRDAGAPASCLEVAVRRMSD